MQKVRVVAFDIGNVLFKNSADRFVEMIVPHTTLKDTEVIKEVFLKGDDFVPRFDKGEISKEEFLKEFKARLKLNVDDEAAARLWFSSMTYQRPMHELVEALRKKGLVLWIISNTNQIHVEHLEFFFPHLFKNFHGKTYSFERGVQCLKPHPYIYCYTLVWIRRLLSMSLDPSECVFIDDLEENCKAAEALGWRTIKHSSIVKTKLLLESLGVEI